MTVAKLHIFTQNGHTFTFQNADILVDNETMLVFRYGAMSDGAIKVGRFSKSIIAGWSATDNSQERFVVPPPTPEPSEGEPSG
jgi:hypothetical protein